MIRSDNGYDFHILDCTEEEKHVLQEYLMKAYIDEWEFVESIVSHSSYQMAGVPQESFFVWKCCVSGKVRRSKVKIQNKKNGSIDSILH